MMNLRLAPPDSAAVPALASTPERIAWLLLLAFVFTIPWEKGVWIPGIGSIARTLGLAAFVVGSATVLLHRRRVRPVNWVLLVAAVFVSWSALTWFWSVDPNATLARSLTLVQLLGMMWLLWEFCVSAQRQKVLLACFLAGAVAGTVIALARYILGIQTYYRRYAATGFDPNTFGLILALAAPMALYLALDASRTPKKGPYLQMAWFSVAALLLSGVLLTASRTALIVCFLGFGFSLLTWKQSGRVQRIASVVLLAFLLLSLGGLAPKASRERLATIPEEISSGSLNSRKQIWKGGLKAWMERPVFGVGAGAYPEAVVPWLGRPKDPTVMNVAHNSILSVMVECGLVGLAIFGMLGVLLLVACSMLPLPERALWLVLLVAWAAGVSTLTWEHHKVTWLLFSLIPIAWAQRHEHPAEELPHS